MWFGKPIGPSDAAGIRSSCSSRPLTQCAVLGLSESLAFELRAADARVGVSLLAPGVVRTRITDAERNRPADVPLSGSDPVRRAVLDQLGGLIRSEGMEPSEVADQVVQAIREDRFYVLTHPDVALTGVHQRRQWMESGIVPEVPLPAPDSR